MKLSIHPGVDAIVGIDTGGRIAFLNKRTEELFQSSKAELQGRPAEVLIPVRLRRAYTERSPINAADPWISYREAGIQFTGRRRDGTEFLAEISSDLLETKSGDVTLLCIRDSISRENLEAQLAQAEKMEALGQFAVGIAHDLNNLLSVILGYTEVILQHSQWKRSVQRNLEEVQKAAITAASLTRELLFFSRKTSLDFQLINLNEIVREMENLLQRLVGEHITMTFVEGPDLGFVKADESQTKQVIMNLVANARDAMPNGGRLVIETANVEIKDEASASSQQLSPGVYVSLKVTDTGRGMDEHTRSRIFKPFFTTKDKGTGFGLATVYAIVKQCGGKISVTSAPMRGTTFTIYMPRSMKGEKKKRDKEPVRSPYPKGK
ncbi:MAG: PAS domain S-box protein [Acidobacteria bacterium]|nr:PAS domain S-box protein [Acidobacteriota bacterium]